MEEGTSLSPLKSVLKLDPGPRQPHRAPTLTNLELKWLLFLYSLKWLKLGPVYTFLVVFSSAPPMIDLQSPGSEWSGPACGKVKRGNSPTPCTPWSCLHPLGQTDSFLSSL